MSERTAIDPAAIPTADDDEAALPSADELRRRAAALFELWRVLDTDVDVAWNRRLATTAGRAFVRRGLIELNPRLLARVPARVDAVLTHEAAHVATFRLFGDNVPSHGRHWRSLMRLAGAEPEVRHTLPVDGLRRRATRRSYVYLRLCSACGDRAVLKQVRYGRCAGCARRDAYLVVKTADTPGGRRALRRMSDADVRAHFS